MSRRYGFVCSLILMTSLTLTCHSLAQEQPSKKSSSKAIQQYRSAVALQNREVYDLAADEWNVFIHEHKDDPLLPKAQHYLGICFFQLGKFKKAEVAFSQSLQQAGNSKLSRENLLHIGLAQFNQGQAGDQKSLERCIKTFGKLTKKYGGSQAAKDAYFYFAEANFASGKYDSAANAYERALESGPGSRRKAAILFGLGSTFQEQGQHKNARETFDRLLRETPDSDLANEARMRRGDSLFESKKFQAAATEFKRLFELSDFEFADYVRMRFAACLYSQKKYEFAAKQYESFTKEFPKSKYVAEASLAAGKAFALADMPDRARPWLEKSLNADRKHAAAAAHWLARIEIASGNPKVAIDLISAALPNAKGDLRIDLQLDQADAWYEMDESRDKASDVYASIAQEYPKHESAPHALYMAAYAALDAKQFKKTSSLSELFLGRYRDDDLRPDVLALRAESELQQEHYQTAADTYESLARQFPKHADRNLWRVRAALSHNLRGNHSDVIRLLEGQTNSIENRELKSEALFLLGAGLYNKNQRKKSIQTLEAALDASPKAAQADRTYFLLAKAYRDVGDQKAASAHLSKLASAFPKSDLLNHALLERAELESEAGNHQLAAANYRRLIESNPEGEIRADALYGLGWVLLQSQKFNDAISAFDSLINLKNHRWQKDAYYGRAVARQEVGQTDDALKDLDAYLGSRPNKENVADANYLKGLCHASKKQFESAVRSFQQALKVDPDYVDADQVMYELAWALDAQGKAADSAKYFRRIAKRFPESRLAAESLFRAAEADYSEEDFESSIRGFRETLAKAESPSLKEQAAHKLGWAHYRLKEFDEAKDAFSQQVRTFADGDLAIDASLMIGECCFEKQDYGSALKAYNSCLNKLSRSKNGQLAALSLLHAGQCAGKLGDWDSSRKHLQKLLKDFPESDLANETNYELAWAMQKTGDTQKASKLYERVANATDSVVGARARFMLGEIQFLDKDYEKAIRTFFKVAYGYGHPEAPKAYRTWQANAMFEAARCCESTKRSDAAERLYKDLIEFHPDSDKSGTAKTKLESIARR